MPTGYTEAVRNGQMTSLRDYALQCARAFGALIDMRDEPMDAPIPERLQADTQYHDEAIAAAKLRISYVIKMSSEDCQKEADAQYNDDLIRCENMVADKAEQRQRYDGMLAQVRDWFPPAPLLPLREFMLSQLHESIRWDCNDAYLPQPQKLLSGSEWQQLEIKGEHDNIAYHKKRRAEEIARVQERQEWLDALRAGLPPV